LPLNAFNLHMFKYSYDSLVYFGEPVDRSIARLARFGYDAIELIGEPAKYDTKEVTRLVGDHGIKVSSICSIFTAERDLASPDKNGRAKALKQVPVRKFKGWFSNKECKTVCF
jgi:sugar phosphate isomerase/epimerase